MADPLSGDGAFPSTLWSQILPLQAMTPQERVAKLEPLIRRYWKPVYWVLKAEGRLQEDPARDLTQDFFVKILEGDVIGSVDPGRGSFRKYLRGALKNFLMNERRRDRALKRGGGHVTVSIDFSEPGREPASLDGDPEKALDQAWAAHLLDEAVAELEAQLKAAGRSPDFEIFRTYDLSRGEKPSYADVSSRTGRSEDEIWTALRFCRRKLREIVVDRIGPYVRDESDLFEELRELFGE